MSEEIKRIVEESKSPKELLDKLDKIDHRLSDEELEMVTGGENTGKNGCTGGTPNGSCSGCSCLTGNWERGNVGCLLSGISAYARES